MKYQKMTCCFNSISRHCLLLRALLLLFHFYSIIKKSDWTEEKEWKKIRFFEGKRTTIQNSKKWFNLNFMALEIIIIKMKNCSRFWNCQPHHFHRWFEILSIDSKIRPNNALEQKSTLRDFMPSSESIYVYVGVKWLSTSSNTLKFIE